MQQPGMPNMTNMQQPQMAPVAQDKLGNDQTLQTDQFRVSGCGRFKTVMQSDGNLVLYKNETNPIWASNTCNKGKGPFVCSMQGDGNLVIYDSTNAPTWASNTCGKGQAPY